MEGWRRRSAVGTRTTRGVGCAGGAEGAGGGGAPRDASVCETRAGAAPTAPSAAAGPCGAAARARPRGLTSPAGAAIGCGRRSPKRRRLRSARSLRAAAAPAPAAPGRSLAASAGAGKGLRGGHRHRGAGPRPASAACPRRGAGGWQPGCRSLSPFPAATSWGEHPGGAPGCRVIREVGVAAQCPIPVPPPLCSPRQGQLGGVPPRGSSERCRGRAQGGGCRSRRRGVLGRGELRRVGASER